MFFFSKDEVLLLQWCLQANFYYALSCIYAHTVAVFEKEQCFASSILRILAWTKFEFVQVKDHTRFQGEIKKNYGDFQMRLSSSDLLGNISKLTTKKIWIKGIQVCLNGGSFPFPRGDKYKIVIIKECPNIRNRSANIIQPWHNAFLGKGKWSLFIWKATFYVKGR